MLYEVITYGVIVRDRAGRRGLLLPDIEGISAANGIIVMAMIYSLGHISGRITSYNVCYTKLLRTA